MMLLMGGCASTGEFDETGGITAIRSACPAVGVPAEFSLDLRKACLFDPATQRRFA